MNKTGARPFKLLVGVLAVLAATTADSRDARAGDCYLSWEWIGYSEIPVWVHPDLAENLIHQNGSSWTDAEVLDEVKYVVETLQENLPSNAPPLVVKGFSSGWAWNSYHSGVIHIAPSLENAACNTISTGAQYGDDSAGVFITVKRSGAGISGGSGLGYPTCDKRWEHFLADNSSPNHSLRAVLNHELLHGIGSNHYNDPGCSTSRTCAVTPCSMVHGGDGDGEYYESPYIFDAVNLIDRYGAFPDNKKHRETADGTTFNDRTPIGSAPLIGMSSDSGTTMAFVQKPGSTLLPYLYTWLQTTPAYTYVGLFSSGAVQMVLGTIGAGEAFGSYFSAFYQDETDEEPRKDIEFGAYSGGSLSSYSKNLDTRQQGISIAYDDNSSRFIVAWRSTNGQISLTTVSVFGTWGTTVWTDTTSLTSDSPSVSCGPSSISYNCILAWAHAPNAGVSTRDLRWRQFSISGSTITWGTSKSHSYTQYGAPSVTYRGPTSSTCAFLFAWKNPGTTAYTRCKATGESASLTSSTEVSHSTPAGKRVMSPSIGSANQNAELFFGWK